MTVWLRALVAALPLPHVTVVFAQHHGDIHQTLVDDECDDTCGCKPRPDGAPSERWEVSPSTLRSWLEAVQEGADIDELMIAIDMAGIGGDQ